MTAGWFDVHVHTAPCVAERAFDDVAVADAYELAGFAGCVLKGHCEPTVGRAHAAGVGRRTALYGGIVLNAPAGGLNPAAVAACLTMGGRVVWMPTTDARAHRLVGLAHPPACAPADGPAAGYALPPVDPSAEAPARRILELLAEADAVLATGHLSGQEAAWLVAAARDTGVRRVLLTHPGLTVPGLAPAEVAALCDLGAVAEVTAHQLLHQHGGDAAPLAALVSAVGVERCVLSSDAGQLDSPPPPQALARLVEGLASAGCDRGALVAAASERPAALVVP